MRYKDSEPKFPIGNSLCVIFMVVTVRLFTCAVLQLLYFWLLLFTPCLEPLLLIGIADLNVQRRQHLSSDI